MVTKFKKLKIFGIIVGIIFVILLLTPSGNCLYKDSIPEYEYQETYLQVEYISGSVKTVKLNLPKNVRISMSSSRGSYNLYLIEPGISIFKTKAPIGIQLYRFPGVVYCCPF
jgi:hypothetical protein